MIVGLSGKKRVGKDSVGEVLAYRYGFKKAAFAKELKDMAYDINPVVDWDVFAGAPVYLQDLVDDVGWEKAKEHPEVRRFLQRLGTEGVRNHLGEDTWVKIVLDQVQPGEHVAVTDCRFPDEAEAVKAAGGYVVRVLNPRIVSNDKHESETALDEWKFDGCIINDGSLAELETKVEDLMGALS